MQIPTKGQILDTKFITEIANAINNIENKIASKTSQSVVSSPSNGNQTTKTSDLIIAGGFERVSNTTTSTVSEVSQLHQFGVVFRYPPIVTATPQVLDTTLSGKNVNVYVKDITTSSVTVVVKFGTTDTPAVGVNVIAVGLPSN